MVYGNKDAMVELFFIDMTNDKVYYFVLYRQIKSNKTYAFEDIFDI